MLLDEMKEELIKRGVSANAKCIPHVMDIMTQDDKYWDLARIDEEIEKKKNELKCLGSKLHLATIEYEDRLKTSKAELDECVKYIEDWYENLCQCESAEGRDKMRAAQVFANTCNIKTCYDNTAFIVGLASILSGETMSPIEAIRQINPRLFNTDSIPPKKDPWANVRVVPK